jgi:DNA polymerase III epsilon subunit-like protein
MILVFDTETTGLPIRNADPKDSQKWTNCRLVQLGWELYTDNGILIQQNCYTVKPVGFTIPDSAAKIHGITTEIALETGIEVNQALTEFLNVLACTDVLVAHNIEFDYKLIMAEVYREFKVVPEKLLQVKQFCTMKHNTKPGQKWPRLGDLYQTLFNREAADCHQADKDVRYCAEIYFKTRD